MGTSAEAATVAKYQERGARFINKPQTKPKRIATAKCGRKMPTKKSEQIFTIGLGKKNTTATKSAIVVSLRASIEKNTRKGEVRIQRYLIFVRETKLDT